MKLIKLMIKLILANDEIDVNNIQHKLKLKEKTKLELPLNSVPQNYFIGNNAIEINKKFILVFLLKQKKPLTSSLCK